MSSLVLKVLDGGGKVNSRGFYYVGRENYICRREVEVGLRTYTKDGILKTLLRDMYVFIKIACANGGRLLGIYI